MLPTSDYQIINISNEHVNQVVVEYREKVEP